MLSEISNFIHSMNLQWELIVAVDGNDGTHELVNLYNNNFKFINSNRSSKREGMGGAIKRAILASSGEYIILMDADGSSKLSEIVNKIGLLETYDIVNFNRYEVKENHIPLKRRFASRSFNLLLRGLFGLRVKDTQCGYKLIKRTTIMPIL
ncbi:MAG: glycosyltransferase, partial [Thermoplasmataceae archaeon]